MTIVVLPGADANLVKSTQGTLASAGAVVGSTITVQDNWIDPDKAAFRATLGQQLAGQVGVPVDQSGGDVVNAVLARSVLAKAGSTAAGAAAPSRVCAPATSSTTRRTTSRSPRSPSSWQARSPGPTPRSARSAPRG